MNDKQTTEILEAAVARACFDYAFRRELLRDAKAALQAAGAELPESLQVHVMEINPNVRYVFLPAPANAADRKQAEVGQPWAVGQNGARAPRAGRHFGFVARL